MRTLWSAKRPDFRMSLLPLLAYQHADVLANPNKGSLKDIVRSQGHTIGIQLPFRSSRKRNVRERAKLRYALPFSRRHTKKKPVGK